MNVSEVARRLQHTNVRPDATRADIDRLIDECIRHGFDGAMVPPIWVPHTAARLEGTPVKVCTAFDYPMGGSTTRAVVSQAQDAFESGAEQIDVMTKVGWLKSGMHAEYRHHLAAIVDAAEGRVVKAMLEAALLTDAELAAAVGLCADAGISYVKNSSGYGGGNASPDVVRTLVGLADGRVRVKASGGIKTLEGAVDLLEAGADLLGASASVAIVSGATAEDGY